VGLLKLSVFKRPKLFILVKLSIFQTQKAYLAVIYGKVIREVHVWNLGGGGEVMGQLH
jgi:hypothetical protein